MTCYTTQQLNKHTSEMEYDDMRDEAIEDIANAFIPDIVAAISCVAKNDIDSDLLDSDIHSLLASEVGEAFLNELAELTLSKRGG